MNDKERQEISVVGRLFSMDVFLCLMGIACLVSGFVTGETMQLFWGGLIVTGSVALHFIRKKDWKAHWEQQELYRQIYLERQEREKREKEEAHGPK
jgi:hypothetical protein